MAFSLKAQLRVALVLVVALGVRWVEAQEHHVVGGDHGWDPANDLASWASLRTFRVGDRIWFTYSAARGQVMELKTKEEYESCDVSNPIKKYMDGIDNVLLDGEGIRYFVSSNIENCKKGLKLHVDVMPQHAPDAPQITTSVSSVSALAAGPTPSASAHVGLSFLALLGGFLVFCVGLESNL